MRYSGDALTSLSNAFNEKSSLASIDKWTVDTSNVTDMDWAFRNCSSLTSLNLSNWKTSNVTNMRSMFNYCTSLASLDLSSFDTSNVTTMDWMFQWCSALTSLDVSSFNTSNVTNMENMFGNWHLSPVTTSITGLSTWNTSKVTNMNSMFQYQRNIQFLDISNFDFSNVTDVDDMFYECSSLTDLQFGKNLKLTLYLGSCPLTHTSALSVLNGLATITTTQAITFKATTYSTLTAAEIKTATDKGWTITSA